MRMGCTRAVVAVGTVCTFACSSSSQSASHDAGSGAEGGGDAAHVGGPEAGPGDAGDAGGGGDATDGGATARKCAPATQVADPLVISGTITQDTPDAGVTPAVGATVEIRKDADDSVLATTTTGAGGNYTLPGIPTGGAPLAAHAHITQPGLVPAIFYVVDGLFTGTLTTALFDPAIHSAAAQAGGVTWNQANGIVSVSVRQCNDGSVTAGLAGAVVTLVPGSTTVYSDASGNPVAGGTATVTPNGDAWDFDVPPGTASVNLLYQGARTTRSIEVAAGGFTFLMDFP